MIVKGIVEEISGGNHTAQYTTREFIIISGVKYRKVELSNYMDEMLKVGEEVELVLKKMGKNEESSQFVN